MQPLDLSADELVSALLHLSQSEPVSILDSCGIGHLGSHLLIAGIEPIECIKLSNNNADVTLAEFETIISRPDLTAIFTISYDFGLKLQKIKRRKKEFPVLDEPDIFLGLFDCLIVHDYNTNETFLTGNSVRFESIKEKLAEASKEFSGDTTPPNRTTASSNFTKESYIKTIEQIKEYIRRGDTYQTNLTQQLTVEFADGLKPETIFWRLRKNHPAPFAAFIMRNDSTVISASPERFIRIDNGTITASPIKGTRPRGNTPDEDNAFRNELLSSKKDLAENTMIVDLLRNDLGRVCEYGSVRVEKLCDLEEHPTLFHLASTIKGNLRKDVSISDIIRAVFPCGSITGAPKIRTMEIIDELETSDRGLTMGAIGIHIPYYSLQYDSKSFSWNLGPETWGFSVAIRTMVLKNNQAIFNVGGGIVIDSEPEKEYDETVLKAKALLKALDADPEFIKLQKTENC